VHNLAFDDLVKGFLPLVDAAGCRLEKGGELGFDPFGKSGQLYFE